MVSSRLNGINSGASATEGGSSKHQSIMTHTPFSIQTDPDSQRLLRVHIFPRTIIHWNALPAKIPTLPTLAQFSGAVCQVIHVSP